jgi:site-specific DNA recombinase
MTHAACPHACAGYARYSSDRQSPVSIEDQFRKLREFAQQQSWRVLENHLYSDEAVSGATDDRAGLKRLLAAATDPKRPFDIVLVDDTSRLSRDLENSLHISKQLKFAGVRIVFVSQGIDTNSQQAELLLATHGIVDQLYVTELASKTRRGVEGRALKGLHTGGRCFGYRRIPVEDPALTDSYGRPVIDGVRLEVDEAQAAIVRRIFTLYATGNSLKRIAKFLNCEGVVSPQPQRGRISRSWSPSSIRVILHNDRYRGVVIWGKTRKVRSPKSGRRLKRSRPETEWVKIESPEQRIVSDDLWQRVQARIEQVKQLYGIDDPQRKAGLLRGRAVTSQYLFSGLLRCGVCGANMTIVAGRGRNHRSQTYGCPMNASRGESVCSNSLRIRRDVLERELLAGLQSKVWREEFINYTLERFEQELQKALKNLDGELAQMRRRKTEIEFEVRNLTEAIAKSGYQSHSVMRQIADREQELSEITNRLLDSEAGSVHARVEEIRKFALSQLADLRQLVSDDVADTLALKTELSKHVQAITVERDGNWNVIAKGSWSLIGRGAIGWCRGAELNCLRRPFQGRALPVSYPGTVGIQKL